MAEAQLPPGGDFSGDGEQLPMCWLSQQQETRRKAGPPCSLKANQRGRRALLCPLPGGADSLIITDPPGSAIPTSLRRQTWVGEPGEEYPEGK